MRSRKLLLDIIGVGPGHPDWVTPQALTALQAADIVVGWDLDLQPVQAWLTDKRVFRQTVKNYRRVIRQVATVARHSRQRVAVPRVGDPCVSSGLKGLLELFHDFAITVIPGISSVQMIAALARINLDETQVVTFHDYGDPVQKYEELLRAFEQGRHLVVLASPDLQPAEMARFLIRHGVPGRTSVVVGSSLTLPSERVLYSTLAGIQRREFHWLTITAIVNPTVASEAADWVTWRRWRRRTGDGMGV